MRPISGHSEITKSRAERTEFSGAATATRGHYRDREQAANERIM